MTVKDTSFGYNMGWLAIRRTAKEKLITTLNFSPIKETNWDNGIDSIYSKEKDNIVYITPDIDGWTFVIGLWAMGTGEEESVHQIEQLITNLSAQFQEVQAFATYRIIEYQHWMVARKGQLIRSFAYLGERAEVLSNVGELTEAEYCFNWDQLKECIWTPSEEEVLEIAGQWSINPTELEISVLRDEQGILARAPII